MEETCETCLYFHKRRKCRRYPPVVIYDIKEVKVVTLYPCVNPDMFCGEYTLRLDTCTRSEGT